MSRSGQWAMTEVLYVTSGPKHESVVWLRHMLPIFAVATSKYPNGRAPTSLNI